MSWEPKRGDIVQFKGQPKAWGNFLVDEVRPNVAGHQCVYCHSAEDGRSMHMLVENAVLVKRSDVLQPYQERVIAEHARVAEDTQKLEAFTGSDFFRSIDTHEQGRMVRQLNHMRGYLRALNDRIAAFKPA